MTDRPSTIGHEGSYAKGIARRREILDRAIEVFAEHGYHGTSLRQIAGALGVSHGALLHYFDSREQLLVAVYERAEQVRVETNGETPEASAVESLVRASAENVQVPGLVQLYTMLVATSLEEGSQASREFFTSRFALVRRDLADRIRRDQDAGRVRRDVDPDAIAAILVAASDGLQAQWLLDPAVELSPTLSTLEDLLRP